MTPPERAGTEPGGGGLEAARLFLRLGTLGFGGPTAHIALMDEECVRRRGWLDRQHFLEMLALTNLIPGPNSTEMAIHIGYLRGGRLVGLLTGITFIMPAFLLMLALSWAYTEYAVDSDSLQALLDGVKPAVLAVIAVSAYRLGRGAVVGWLTAALGLISLAVTVTVPEVEIAVLVAAGLVTWIGWRRPALSGSTMLFGPLVAPFTLQGVELLALLATFLVAGGALFGGGYVLIPLIEPVVVERGWLTHEAFLDGVALGQATPGPITITAAFVGYAVSGVIGATLATAAVFAPAFVFVLFGIAPFGERMRASEGLRAFLGGVSAAVVGAIAGAVVTLAGDAIPEPWLAAVLAGSLLALLRGVNPALVIAVGGAVGGLGNALA